jgi:YfiH family protein
MIHEPFTLFHPFADHLQIDFCRKEDDIHNDDSAAQVLGITEFASAQQVHGKKAVIVRNAIRRFPDADGLMTDAIDLTLLIRVADCQSFVFYAPKKHLIGVLHAGWRGVVGGAIPAFFEVLKNEWGIGGNDVLVGAGPSLCQRCAEFTDPVHELPGIDARFFDARCVDLRGIADQQLMDAGVQKDQMERSPDCTKCRNDLYWSYRGGDRDAVKNGYENVLSCTLL